MPYILAHETQCSNCKHIYDKEKPQCPKCRLNGTDRLDTLLKMAKVPDKATLGLPLNVPKAS